MKIFRQTRGIVDKVIGAKKRSSLHPETKFIDPLQQYTTVGEYHVDGLENTPGGKKFVLTVYKDENGILHQALSPENTQNLAPEYVRSFNEELGRFRAFKNKKTGRRWRVEKYLDSFVESIKPRIREGENSVNIGVITDTHFKDRNSIDFYGWNGLTHVHEFSYLDDKNLLNMKVHLGDWIDGSDAGLVSESELYQLRDAFKSDKVPYVMIKGNHDENDKFDEHHDLRASFPENEFENIMWKGMYKQARIRYISRQHGVCYYDFDDVRVISVNTSDIPYELDSKGQKKYDEKITLAVREDQIEEIIEILSKSSGKKIILMSHANPINRKGSNALKYNGRSLHELLVAFNQREKGRMHSSKGVPPEFRLSNDFDFTNIKDARIIAYFCGHRHREDQYRINGIQYILFNCSALMGANHSLTTKYNKNWHRKIDTKTEYAGYVVNVDLKKHRLQVFGYGAASKRKVFFI
ncbi:metallophosphoesterase [Lactobacillus sp. LL6]|uniref:metallophosphoesterase family protein n=1 Tax=Lactobacillus sp. LL6 TaxID=2596827 RepID=UPI001186B840|nr:metallophosphoesterase [Lactobacillus sp. LL6]TSO25656.1 metallophosphoesterase [Lactobacillus sp. LL6]